MSSVSRLVVFCLLLHVLGLGASAQESQLGRVVFPNFGSKEAQAPFLRGLAALHSFWYEEALDEFREASRIDPEFVMAYWGEAMTYNHPLWNEQDTEAARKALEKIKDASRVSPRERTYVEAVRLLYGQGDKDARDLAYSTAMERVYVQHPDDLEAASFYALSLLGLVRPTSKGYRMQAKAGAVALDVYRTNPNHPGAAHYIIHAFDDPEHAILALPAARRYAEIAPAAHHARHMPSHIFLQLGMWPEATRSNESAWEVSDAWVKRKNLSLTNRDYHSLHWLLYVYLQEGRYGKAEQLLELMKKTMTESKDDRKLRPNYYRDTYASMAATFVIETERWDLASTLFGEPKAEGESARDGGGDHAHGPQPGTASQSMTVPRSNSGKLLPLFVRGLAAAQKASAEAEKSVEALRDLRKSDENTYRAKRPEVMEIEIAAVSASVRGNHSEAVELMKRATKLEDEMAPPSGPPSLIKPSHELYGEILLRAGRPREAEDQFATALLRQPNRARSLIGAARAANSNGNRKAGSEFYSRFLKQWHQSDKGLPELREAADHVKISAAEDQRGRSSR